MAPGGDLPMRAHDIETDRFFEILQNKRQSSFWPWAEKQIEKRFQQGDTSLRKRILKALEGLFDFTGRKRFETLKQKLESTQNLIYTHNS